MAAALKNIVVVGGSYVGINTARELMAIAPATHRVLLIEPHSHFNHIFTFPRFAILSGHEHKAFVPYSGIFTTAVQHKAIKARATHVHPDHVQIDAKWEGSNTVPFDYLVLATGTRLAAPSMMPFDDKVPSVQYLQAYQDRLQQAKHVTIVGGGAVGVQMALDLRELYPQKEVTLVHSRDALMHQFHRDFHKMLKDAFDQQGIQLITGTRATVPEGGFPKDGKPFTVHLSNGEQVETEFVIPATGQKPNNELINTLPTTNPEGLINQTNGFIRVKPSLQLQDDAYRNIFAVGDIADTGVHKAARPGAAQARVVATNILSMLSGANPEAQYEKSPRAIHLSLGLKRNVIFRNPDEANGQTEPTVIEKFDGRADMGVEGMWSRLNATLPVQYDGEAAVRSEL